MIDTSYSGRNPNYRRAMDGCERAVRDTETQYARQIQQQVPGIGRDEALRIAAKWARKDLAWKTLT